MENHQYQTPFGSIKLFLNNQLLTRISFHSDSTLDTLPETHSLFVPITKHLLTDPQRIPHQLIGTEFQKKVWQALLAIPKGETTTYGELAKKLNSHPRAVGQALKRNPLPLLYPCHRVVSQKDLGGFSGETSGKLMTIKQWLLEYEANS